MKYTTMTIATLLASLSLPAWAQGDQGDQPKQGEGWVWVQQPKQVRDHAPSAMVEAAFLGVNAQPLDFDTAKRLGIPRGIGLMISYVAEDSPAAQAGLKKGDAITKLDDQLLINPEQLAVLVRTHKAGDKIALHISRGGAAMKLDAQLVTRKLPALGPGGRNLTKQWRIQQNAPRGVEGIALPGFEPGALRWDADALKGKDLPPNVQKMVEQMRKRMQEQMETFKQHRVDVDKLMEQMRQQLDLDIHDLKGKIDVQPGQANASGSVMTFDGEHEIKLVSRNGKRHLTIKDKNGKVIFDGPMPDNGKVPGLDKKIQDKVDKLLVNTGIDIRKAPAPQEKQDPAIVDVQPGQSGASGSASGSASDKTSGSTSGNASGSAMTFDGEHKIKLVSSNGKRHLTIKDKNDKVIFDGPMPDNGQVPGLDKEIQDKVDKLLVNTGIEIRKAPAPQEKQDEPAKEV